MFEFLQRLVASIPASPARRAFITPGRLYAKLSGEFRVHREKVGCSCIMPLPMTCDPANVGGCNWQIHKLWSQCPACDEYLEVLVPRFQAQYDVRDPTFSPETSKFNPLQLDEELIERLG